MSDLAETSRIRFGVFQLDEQTGELWRGEGDEQVVDRLPPQATRLLAHLIASRPQVVTRGEIRQLLWPDVEVDFEQSLHSCIRKIRATLGDSASDPRYVETIPRRGYRFIGTVEDAVDQAAMEPAAMEPAVMEPAVMEPAVMEPAAGAIVTPEAKSRRFSPIVAAVGLGLVMVLIVASLRFGSGQARARIAVMPIAGGEDIAGAIVNILTHQLESTVEIIGPTTTESYKDRPRRIRALIEELDIDYVINARSSTGELGPRLLIEIIRGRDGAHVWVKYLDEFPAGREAAEVIAEAMASSVF